MAAADQTPAASSAPQTPPTVEGMAAQMQRAYDRLRRVVDGNIGFPECVEAERAFSLTAYETVPSLLDALSRSPAVAPGVPALIDDFESAIRDEYTCTHPEGPSTSVAMVRAALDATLAPDASSALSHRSVASDLDAKPSELEGAAGAKARRDASTDAGEG